MLSKSSQLGTCPSLPRVDHARPASCPSPPTAPTCCAPPSVVFLVAALPPREEAAAARAVLSALGGVPARRRRRPRQRRRPRRARVIRLNRPARALALSQSFRLAARATGPIIVREDRFFLGTLVAGQRRSSRGRLSRALRGRRAACRRKSRRVAAVRVAGTARIEGGGRLTVRANSRVWERPPWKRR